MCSGVIGWYREVSYQESTECSDGMGRWLTKKTQSATAVFSCRDGLESNVSMRYSVASTCPMLWPAPSASPPAPDTRGADGSTCGSEPWSRGAMETMASQSSSPRRATPCRVHACRNTRARARLLNIVYYAHAHARAHTDMLGFQCPGTAMWSKPLYGRVSCRKGRGRAKSRQN